MSESRERFVAGLRAAADLYENHPELPVPSPVRIYTTPYTVTRTEAQGALLVAVRATGHQPAVKNPGDHYAEVKVTEQISLMFDLEQVGEQRSVTREVTEWTLPTQVAS